MKVDLYSEEEILKACKKNKREFQEILYRRYAKKMYGICMSYAGIRDVAQDILQESFIKIFKKIKDFNMDGSLEGWVRRIVVNTAIDHLRKEKRSHSFISEEMDFDNNSEAAFGYENLKTKDILEQVSKLPDGARIVFNLYAIDGFTHKEIAQKLNISEGTSKSQFSRARKLLMTWLNKLSA
ncbi:MAG: RNA polymerase sigma factor [Bacteroidales bacterium]|nr:RNA polymerase sigma factor [Bacteroidales bacterium]